MNKVEKARKLISDFPFGNGSLEKYGNGSEGLFDDGVRGFFYDGKRTGFFSVLDKEILARSFNYLIDVVEGSPGNRLGYSKFYGKPHMREDWLLPKEWSRFEFWFQLNFEQLKKFDKFGRFPETGTVYVFQHVEEGACRIIYDDTPAEKLTVRKDISTLEDRAEEAMEFVGKFIFYVGQDTYDYREICKFIPDALRIEIERILDAAMAKFDPSVRILGRPHYWQGEDEYSSEDGVLLFQGNLHDASIHIWVPAEDLRNGRFDRAWETFSTS